jgi:hypothetical protein
VHVLLANCCRTTALGCDGSATQRAQQKHAQAAAAAA